MTEFDSGYFKRFKRSRPWRAGGDQPITYRTWIRELSGFVQPRESTLLDCGCGEGYFLRRASGFRVCIGVDISSDGLATARIIAPHAEFLLTSATDLPLPDASVDVIVAADLVEHLSQPADFFREAHRVLRPAGIMLLSTPNPRSLGARLKGDAWFGWRDPTHISIAEPARWRDLLEEWHFGIISDGTDALWDTPYLPAAKGLQWLLLMPIKHALMAFRSHYPWTLGENYIALARRVPDGSTSFSR